MKLFPELMLSIIEEVAIPDSPLAHVYPHPVHRTLLGLALASHSLYSLTMPFIYTRIRINSQNRLQILHRTLCSQSAIRRRIKSFAILKPSGSDQDYNLTQVFVQQICDILDIISPSLQRLVLDLPYSHEQDINGRLRDALLRLPHIVEFASIRYAHFIQQFNSDHVVLRNWKSILRLALWTPVMDPKFQDALMQLPHLEHFVLLRAGPNLTNLIRTSSSLRIITLIDPPKWNLRTLVPIMKERSDIRFNLHLPEDLHGYPDAGTESWYRSEVERGTLWDGEGPTWEKRLGGIPWQEALQVVKK